MQIHVLSSRIATIAIVLASTSSVLFGESINPLTDPLPEAVSSFGAVVSDGSIYVYGGHIGTAHDHSKNNLSQAFRRRSVAGGAWEDLPMETPLQGLALVAWQGSIYRIGGMTAFNAIESGRRLALDGYLRQIRFGGAHVDRACAAARSTIVA